MEAKSSKEYTAKQIQVLKGLPTARDNVNFGFLQNMIKKRGDQIKISRKFKIDRSTLTRGIAEHKITSIFPNILKSKAPILSTIKLRRELELFSKNYDINKLSPQNLYKKIKEWRKILENNPLILLKQEQHDLIIGSTIGDVYIRQREENCNFRVGHSKAQKKYLMWKYNIMKEFSPSKPKWNIRKFNSHIIETLELATHTHYVFNYYRKLFYENNRKRITREILDMLNPRSLAIWLCDDGSYDNRQGYIILCTNSYTFEEHQIMKKYFEEVFGLSPTIGFRDKKYYYLRFKQNDSKKLIEIVKPHIPEFMKYKIGEKNG